MPTTKLFKIENITKDSAMLAEAAGIIRAGGLVAIPTETVYGLAADATSETAIKAIFAAKGRPQDNPLIVHICSVEQLYEVAGEVPKSALLLAKHFWPGPLTIILPRGKNIPAVTSAGLDTVAVRYPAHHVAQELIRLAGVPLAAPSANLSGSPSTTTAQHCINDLDGKIAAIVDGGACEVGVESTVITLVGAVPRILRPGYITLENLQAVLGVVEVDAAVTGRALSKEQVSSPGMKYKHYSPHCKVVLLQGGSSEFASYVNSHIVKGCFALCYDEDEKNVNCPCVLLGAQQDEKAQAARLFESLRTLDDKGAQVVYARCPQQKGVGLALYNRLIRAAGFTVVEL